MGQAELKMTYRTLRIFCTVYTVIVFVERGVEFWPSVNLRVDDD